jgi:hypothetical protein
MPLRRKLLMIVAPLAGAAALGGILGFSVPALAASPSPSPAASSNPSNTAPAPGGQAGNGAQPGQGHCPNM